MKDQLRVAVFTNPDRDPDYSYTKKVIRTLLACDADVLTDMRFRGCVGESREDVKFYTYTEEMLKIPMLSLFSAATAQYSTYATEPQRTICPYSE